MAELVSVTLEKRGEDLVITKNAIEKVLNGKMPEAIVIRTYQTNRLKNQENIHILIRHILRRLRRFHSRKRNKHLLIDLPSVDKEKDEGNF
jgi:hypothetical protein